MKKESQAQLQQKSGEKVPVGIIKVELVMKIVENASFYHTPKMMLKEM